jgi:hypothetical protein
VRCAARLASLRVLAWQRDGVTDGAKPIPEARSGERLALLCHQESQVIAWCGLDCSSKFLSDLDMEWYAGLLAPHREHTIADVLPSPACGGQPPQGERGPVRAGQNVVSVIPVCGCLRRIAFRDPLVSAGRQLARRSGAVPFSLQSG